MASPALLWIVGALMNDKEARLRFNENPTAVMDQFQLSKTDRAVLLRMDKLEIEKAIRAMKTMEHEGVADKLIDEVNHYTLTPGEIQPSSEEYLAEADQSDPDYPAPLPRVFKVRPERVSGPVDRLELIVTGQSFPPGLKLSVTGEDGKPLKVSREKLFGTYRSSRYRAVLGAAEGEEKIKAQRYRVSVTVNPNCFEGTTDEEKKDRRNGAECLDKELAKDFPAPHELVVYAE